MWEAVAEGRLHGGLRQFDLKVDYTEDFGVNTDLETKVRRLNLDIGGEFKAIRFSRWRMTGSFEPVDSS